jgi:hypothetical protein
MTAGTLKEIVSPDKGKTSKCSTALQKASEAMDDDASSESSEVDALPTRETSPLFGSDTSSDQQMINASPETSADSPLIDAPVAVSAPDMLITIDLSEVGEESRREVVKAITALELRYFLPVRIGNGLSSLMSNPNAVAPA